MKEHHHMRWSDTDPDLYLGRRLSGTGGHYQWSETGSLTGLKKSGSTKLSECRWGVHAGKRQLWFTKHARLILFTGGLMGLLFLFDSLVVSFFDSNNHHSSLTPQIWSRLEDESGYREQQKQPVQLYGRLLNLASASLDEKELKHDLSKLWVEPYKHASLWKPCAERTLSKDKALGTGNSYTSNGFIVVSANGGLNQQRVAICNAVALASLLNATLVLPKFLYSNVWKDPSQFGDIYQEEHFMNVLKDDIDIARELPFHLKSLDMDKIGSLITDADIAKEAKPTDYLKNVLPILWRNGVVHLLGFGNRLAFDPVTSNLQKLRCKCNFHALRFVPKIQKIGSLLIRRIRKYDGAQSELDKQLLGTFMSEITGAGKNPSKYLALHLRFEVDMVAYSFCDFGGGDNEKRELQAYRERHFPLLLQRLKSTKYFDPRELRQLGKCPLTPEEAALVLSGLGVKRGTYIYLAGSQIYGGKSRMLPFTSLYPNLVTKENLLTPAELAPLRNFSSQLAALDFIACATADVFAMTDSGSQLSSLVSGFRTYYGGGHAPTLRPNKKELAAILSENSTISWNTFEERVREMIEQGQEVHLREFGRSIYRLPRCPECMCRSDQ